MVIALNDILRFTSHYESAGNEALMVSYWQVTDVTDVAPNVTVAEAFHRLQQGANIIGGLMSAGAKATRTVMDNMSSPLEFGDFALDLPGLNGAAQQAPDFVAILIRQTRFNRATRNGYKRVPFTNEAIIDVNGLNVGSTVRTATEEWFGDHAHLTGTYSGETIDVTLEPIIVGRTLVGGSYVPDLSRINPVTGATILRPTTQASRKRQ